LQDLTGSADAGYRASKDILKAGDLAGAGAHLTAMIAAWPDDSRFRSLLAFVYDRQGNTAAALKALIAALEIDDSVAARWQELWAYMRRTGLAPDRRRLLSLLGRALQRDGIDHRDAEREGQAQVLSMLKRQDSPTDMARWALAGPDDSGADPDGEREFLLVFLEHAPTTDSALETLLTALRRTLLELAAAGRPALLELASALAMHCFRHEYVFSESDAEAIAVEALLQAGAALDPVRIAMAAAYRPLHGLDWTHDLPLVFAQHPSGRFARLLKAQIRDPAEEAALRGSIPPLTPIGAGVSQAVRAQYEENPYPRWHYLATPRGEATGPQAMRRILIAGGGTGRQACAYAKAWPSADVWTVDLSLSSLAYGARMAKEYRFKNIRFFHGDILQLGDVDAQFERIVCDGVLHHLGDPEHGLNLLRDKLAPGGRLQLSVYAATGRVAILAGIALRQRLGLPPTVAGIRKVREAILALPPDDTAAAVTRYHDFFFTSECRDLLFHVQERTYTLNQLDALFARARLKVLQLTLPENGAALYRARNPQGDPDRDLAGWAEIEKGHTDLFGPMYACNLALAD
jgi:SAM-dependent methyltransferase